MSMQINKLAQHLGGEVTGLDIRGVTPDMAAQIKLALLKHGVLVFRDQDIEDDDQISFARLFGTTETIVREEKPKLAPEIIELNDTGDPTTFTYTSQYWHTDGSFKRVPSYLTLLRALEISPEGGDTGFANTCAGFEALPDARKRELRRLRVRHDIQHTRDRVKGLPPFPPQIKAAYPGTEHDLVRTIPETGRELLYLGSHASEVVGMSYAESQTLLNELLEWTTQPQFTYQHKWRSGDLVVWDNRGLLHRALPYDATRYRRVMRRAEVMGLAA